MHCEQVERLLSQHLEGPLSASEVGRLETHLDACSACRRRQEEFLTLRSRLRALAEEIPATAVERTAIDLWLAERAVPTRHRWHWARPGWRASAHGKLSLGGALVALFLATCACFWWDHFRLTGLPRDREQPLAIHGTDPRPAEPFPSRDPTRAVLPAPPRVASGRHPLPVPTTGHGQSAKKHPSGLTTELARGTPFDDLAAFNHDPREAIQQWVRLPPEEWEKIEARVRRGVQVRDDFVTVPFPRLAATSERLVAEAVAGYKREAAIVDPRLAHEVTCGYKATALSDLCDRLQSETGIQLSAGSSVADEKVTLFCEKQPLRDVMRQLSRPFGYTWLRSGKAGAYRYELAQDLRSQLLEEELRNQDRNQALLDMEQQAQRYRPYLDLSPEEALARAATAPPAEKEILKHYAGKGWGPAQLFFRLTPGDMATLRAGQTVTFSASPGPGEQRLPPELARNVIASLRDYHIMRQGDRYEAGPVAFMPEGRVPAAVPEAQPVVSLKLLRGELGQISLSGWSGFFIGPPPPNAKIGLMGDGERNLADGISPAVRSPRNAVVNAALARDPALRKIVTVGGQGSGGRGQGSGVRGQGSGTDAAAASAGPSRLAPRPPTPDPRPLTPDPRPPTPDPKVTSADVLETLHRATGMSIVSDYYTRLFRPEEVAVQNQPLFDALNRLADAMRMRWHKEAGGGHAVRSGAGPEGKAGDWLQFRTTSCFNDRLKEVPNRLLNRWATARRRNGALTVEEMVEIAQLTDVQLDSRTMAEGARVLYGLAEWQLAGARQHWRFLAGFTPEQRQAAQSPAGLPFREMSLAQQQRFLALALESSSVRLDALEELAEGGLQVELLPPVGFQLQAPKTGNAFERGLDAPRARGQTREAALDAARRIDPNVTPAQIVAAEMSVTFTYRLGGPKARLTPMIAHLDTHNFVTRWPEAVGAIR